ncbi:hypothetical protein MRX96_014894 [Rhipicephalus microplus]
MTGLGRENSAKPGISRALIPAKNPTANSTGVTRDRVGGGGLRTVGIKGSKDGRLPGYSAPAAGFGIKGKKWK